MVSSDPPLLSFDSSSVRMPTSDGLREPMIGYLYDINGCGYLLRRAPVPATSAPSRRTPSTMMTAFIWDDLFY